MQGQSEKTVVLEKNDCISFEVRCWFKLFGLSEGENVNLNSSRSTRRSKY